jgi:hypothetical protein
MGAGALGLILVVLLNSQRSRSVGTHTTVIEEERHTPRDPRV